MDISINRVTMQEEIKVTSSITKLFEPFTINLPIDTYSHFAIDANNLLGESISPVSTLLWKLHTHHWLSQEDLLSLTRSTNTIISNYFQQLSPLLKAKSTKSIWLVFDGLKPKLISWAGQKKHSYYWPVIADECIQKPRKQLQNQKDKPQKFWWFLQLIKSNIMSIAEQLGIKIFVAPYQGDTQIIKMLHEGIVDCVISHDYQFVHFGVPMVLNLLANNTIDAIDFKITKPEHLKGDQLLVRWLKEANPQKREMFSVLSGSKYMSHFRALSFRGILEVVLESPCLSQFFRVVSKRYNIETKKIKNFHGTFEETASKLLLLNKFQLCYSFTKQQQEPLNSLGFEAHFRQNYIHNSDKEVERVKKIMPCQARVLENKHQNREFDRVFSLIGDYIEKYDEFQSYRNGHKKIQNGKLRHTSEEVMGEGIEERLKWVLGRGEWVSVGVVKRALNRNGGGEH